ncbi:hypothetical protein [Lentibacter sp. XHP0401]|uniref:hypothetical protein n=1 Tax=Lentibacter sp. XHP0401 TaxID=2984334 RepID=UPI0021E82CCE|nr:hypothetical protein [Lentibacter sp. XHP0401]MCV2894570.1 hypothetical protein [Lentibacter sp. XHP0401]
MKDTKQHLRKTPAKSRAVRPIPKSSKAHFVGELVFNRGDQLQRLGFASLLEYHAALCLIYRSDFLDLEEQLAAQPFTLPNGKPSKQFFDFRFTQKSGRRICISVKPERIANTAIYQALMERVSQAAIGNICDDVKTITERNIHPVQLHNSKLFHAARDPEPEVDEAVLDGLRKVSAPISVIDFLTEMEIGGRGFFSVARAIRYGQASLLTPERIVGETLIESRVAA